MKEEDDKHFGIALDLKTMKPKRVEKGHKVEKKTKVGVAEKSKKKANSGNVSAANNS